MTYLAPARIKSTNNLNSDSTSEDSGSEIDLDDDDNYEQESHTSNSDDDQDGEDGDDNYDEDEDHKNKHKNIKKNMDNDEDYEDDEDCEGDHDDQDMNGEEDYEDDPDDQDDSDSKSLDEDDEDEDEGEGDEIDSQNSDGSNESDQNDEKRELPIKTIQFYETVNGKTVMVTPDKKQRQQILASLPHLSASGLIGDGHDNNGRNLRPRRPVVFNLGKNMTKMIEHKSDRASKSDKKSSKQKSQTEEKLSMDEKKKKLSFKFPKYLLSKKNKNALSPWTHDLNLNWANERRFLIEKRKNEIQANLKSKIANIINKDVVCRSSSELESKFEKSGSHQSENDQDQDQKAKNHVFENAQEEVEKFKVDLNNLDKKIDNVGNELEKNDITLDHLLKVSEKLSEKNRVKLVRLFLARSNIETIVEHINLTEKIQEILNQQCFLPDNLAQIKQRIDAINVNEMNLYQRILSLQTTDKNIAAIDYKFQSIATLSNDDDNEEVSKVREWIDLALKLPTKCTPLREIFHRRLVEMRAKSTIPSPLPQSLTQPLLPQENKGPINHINNNNNNSNDLDHDHENEIGEYLKICKQVMDENLYGMNNEKKELIKVVNDMLKQPNCKPTILGLVGEPGTGKTEIIRTLGKACGLEFEQISLGGCTESASLDGFGFTYIGSQPGQVARALMRMSTSNGIIYFDEFDKLSTSNRGRDVTGVLLHILDQTANSEFKDKYFDGLTIDLSKIWFVLSMNDAKLIDPILLNRIRVIPVAVQTTADKLQIIKKFTIPRVLKNIGLNADEIIFPDQSIQKLIQYQTNKENGKSFGMRVLNQHIGSILGQVNLIKTIFNSPSNLFSETELKSLDIPKNIKFPFLITEEIALEFSGLKNDPNNWLSSSSELQQIYM